jgi:hypothetical protein
MSKDRTTVIDEAVAELRDGVPVELILARRHEDAVALTPLLHAADALTALLPVPELPAATRQADRMEFMARVEALQPQPVSPAPLVRLKEWVAQKLPARTYDSPDTERRSMSALIAKATVALVLLLGSLGGTAAVAADSLPGSPLYPIKIAMEDVQLAFTTAPGDSAELHLAFATERADEIVALVAQGEAPDDALLQQLQSHLELMVQEAAQAPAETMSGLLVQAENMIRTQEQALVRLRQNFGETQPLRAANQVMTQAREQIRAAMGEPEQFRERHMHGQSDEPEELPSEVTPRQGGVFSGTQPVTAPGGAGPGQSANPDCPDCEPVGDEHRYGPRPDQPGPGEPGGNPDCPDCEPAGDEHRYGPQPDQPGPGEPGGNPDCPNCPPEGNQNQNGQNGGQPEPGSGNDQNGGSQPGAGNNGGQGGNGP